MHYFCKYNTLNPIQHIYMIKSASKATPMLKARSKEPRAKQSETMLKARSKKKKGLGLLCEALNGDNARSVKQAILFERSEFNRL
jgi:hypothetical protein